MFCDLEEERTWFRKKKKRKKKEKNLIAAKSGLVGIKGYFKTYNRVKYFLPYLSCFWIRWLFYTKLAGRFSGPKTEVAWPIGSKFGTNISLINLKLLSKFQVARPNHCRIVSKSLKLPTDMLENGRGKTKGQATRASIVPMTTWLVLNFWFGRARQKESRLISLVLYQ